MNKDIMLALLSHYKYGTLFHDNTTDATIVALEELAFLRGYDTNMDLSESVPDGTTHVDLNDSTNSKWIKLESSGLMYYTGEDWISFTSTDHNVHIVTLEEWRNL